MIYNADECIPNPDKGGDYYNCIVTLADGTEIEAQYNHGEHTWHVPDCLVRYELHENPVTEWRYKGEME